MCRTQSATHSTFCSLQRGMLQKEEALCGPTRVNMLGKPEIWMPSSVFGPSAHFSFRLCPPQPRMSMRSKPPVTASKPVA